MNARFIALAAALGAAIAAHAQTPGPRQVRDMAAACAICHGTNGQAPGGMPALAGQSADTLARHLRDFRDGKRPATIMHQIAKGYTEEQIGALATFFASQKPK